MDRVKAAGIKGPPWWALGAVAPGLGVGWLLGALQVWLSNRALETAVAAMDAAGWVIVPNRHVLPLLSDVGPALLGGLFYGLSIGAFLTVGGAGAAWCWDRLMARSRLGLAVFIGAWAYLLVAVNAAVVAPMASVYFILTPPVAFLSTLWWMPPSTSGRAGSRALVHGLALLLLGIIGSYQLKPATFVIFRDRWLLTHPAGIALSDFYYRYTLYPAEAFKNRRQKLLNACRVSAPAADGPMDAAMAGKVAHRLIRYDYLPVDPAAAAPLRVDIAAGDRLRFTDGPAIEWEAPLKHFLERPGNMLTEFSEATDRHGTFRHLVFIAIVGMSGMALYLIPFLPLRWLAGRWLDDDSRFIAPACLSLLTAGAFFLTLQPWPEPDVGKALASDDWRLQAAALDTVVIDDLEITAYPSALRLMDSPRIPVRYRLALALGKSGSDQANAPLFELARDPSLTVVYHAAEALGRKKPPGAEKVLMEMIRDSRLWYIQLYAYNALRNLGWRQNRSR